MDEKLMQAWQLFTEGQVAQAKKLVSADFDLLTCEDDQLLNFMGYVVLSEQDYEGAIQIYQRLLSVAKNQPDSELEHIAWHQLAMVYRESKQYEQALKLIEKERTIIDHYFVDDLLKKAVNDYEQGYLRLKLGDAITAKKWMENSLQEALLTDDEVAKACSYRGLGEITLALKDKQKSKKYFQKAYEHFAKVDEKQGMKEVQNFLAQLSTIIPKTDN